MKVRIQRATAEGCRFITLPENVLKAVGWKELEDIYIDVITDRKGKATHVVLEKR